MKMMKILIGRQKLPSTSGLSCFYRRKKRGGLQVDSSVYGAELNGPHRSVRSQAKKCLDIVGANLQMSEFEARSSVHG